MADQIAEEIEKILEAFVGGIMDNQKDLPPEFQKVVDDNFWELLE